MEVFGVCSSPNYHGHNFRLQVTVRGAPDPQTGLVIDMNLLGKIIRQHVIDRVDHKNLNLEVDFLKDRIASCETIVEEFWKILDPQVRRIAPLARLHSLRLRETENNFVEYLGD